MFKSEIVTFRSILVEKGYPTLKCSIEQLWVLKQRQRVSEIQQYSFLGHKGDKAASVVGFVDLLRDKSNKLDLHETKLNYLQDLLCFIFLFLLVALCFLFCQTVT